MSGWRFAMFLVIALGIWALMHLFVFWRASSVPWLAGRSHRMLWLAAFLLWASYPVARMLASRGWMGVARPLEFVAANWIGVLFLLFAALLAVEVVTLGGLLFAAAAPGWRGGAIVVAGGLSVFALVQGLRPPVVRECEVRLAGLPAERDGLVLVAISDLHLGTLIGTEWLSHLVTRVNDLHPDLVAVVGDLVDGDVNHAEETLPVLKRLTAPLGVWAVTGNHEYYAGLEGSVRLFEAAGFHVLRDRWASVAPGLTIAGVDDLTARRQYGDRDQAVANALAGRPAGATIFLSHTPWQAEKPAAAGVGLMLCGHTHGGQLWPFSYLVRLEYRLLGGRYEVGGMPVIVSHGTGTWGPRMRLWRPSEFWRITLRRAS